MSPVRDYFHSYLCHVLVSFVHEYFCLQLMSELIVDDGANSCFKSANSSRKKMYWVSSVLARDFLKTLDIVAICSPTLQTLVLRSSEDFFFFFFHFCSFLFHSHIHTPTECHLIHRINNYRLNFTVLYIVQMYNVNC